jgi:hypothetical protein
MDKSTNGRYRGASELGGRFFSFLVEMMALKGILATFSGGKIVSPLNPDAPRYSPLQSLLEGNGERGL